MEQLNEERNYLVYMHVNKSNNKVYIGVTSKLPHQRWGLNGHNYKTGQTAFFGALKNIQIGITIGNILFYNKN